jgi:hypothetical protein
MAFRLVGCFDELNVVHSGRRKVELDFLSIINEI